MDRSSKLHSQKQRDMTAAQALSLCLHAEGDKGCWPSSTAVGSQKSRGYGSELLPMPLPDLES